MRRACTLYSLMPTLTLSLNSHNIRHHPSNFEFSRTNPRRFQWIALLAHQWLTQHNEGWVSLEEIQNLPEWRGMGRHHTGTTITRYLARLQHLNMIEARTPTRGPYRLHVSRIVVDGKREDLADLLGAPAILTAAEPNLKQLREFLPKHLRAVVYLNQWRLVPDEGRAARRRAKTAIEIWTELARNEKLHSVLRLVSYTFLATVADDTGKYDFGLGVCDEAAHLLTPDSPAFLRARLFMAKAWLLYRKGDLVEEKRLLADAWAVSGDTQDAFLGGVHLTRLGIQQGYSTEAVNQFRRALLKYLMIENYQRVQDACYNIGRVLQPIDSAEALLWLTLSMNIASSMQVGTSRIMTAVLLSKLWFQNDNREKYLEWRHYARERADLSRNPLDRAWVLFLCALDDARKGETDALVQNLRNARKLYMRSGFGWAKLDQYFSSKFGAKTWAAVLKGFHNTPPSK